MYKINPLPSPPASRFGAAHASPERRAFPAPPPPPFPVRTAAEPSNQLHLHGLPDATKTRTTLVTFSIRRNSWNFDEIYQFKGHELLPLTRWKKKHVIGLLSLFLRGSKWRQGSIRSMQEKAQHEALRDAFEPTLKYGFATSSKSLRRSYEEGSVGRVTCGYASIPSRHS